MSNDTATGPLGTLKLLGYDELDPNQTDAITHLYIKFSLDKTTFTESLIGFKVKCADIEIEFPIVWTIPPALNIGLAGNGDSKTPVTNYAGLLNIATSTMSFHEDFEAYSEGEISVPMNYGGAKWDGPWRNIDSYLSNIGYLGYGDNFESYVAGVQTDPLAGGTSFNGPWRNTLSYLSDIGYLGYGDNFESYAAGVQTDPLSGGTGFNGAWRE